MGTRHEIAGFEGYSYSGNGRTSIQDKTLNNKDAIALIIHALCQTMQHDAEGHEVRVALGMWRGIDSDKACDKKFSGYFNSGEQYGYLGGDAQCTHSMVWKKCKMYRIATYWYRTCRGYYALTKTGEERVAVLLHERARQKAKESFNMATDLAINETIKEMGFTSPSGQAKSPAMAEMATNLFGDGTVPLIDGSDEEFKVVLGRDRDAKCRTKIPVLVAFERGSCPSDMDIVREVRMALDTALHEAIERARTNVNECSTGAACVLERRSA